MTALGPGVRVYVKFIPADGNLGAQYSARTGTALAGPIPPGTHMLNAEDGRVYYFSDNTWEVQIDGLDAPAIVDEHLLVPIDDEDDEVITEQQLEGEIA